MMKSIRALCVTGLIAFASGGATTAFAFEPESPQCIAPSGAGGGWDFTCRQVGKAMQDQKLISSTMRVVNAAGGGGGVAYAEVVNKMNDDNDLIVAASSATATRLAQGAYPGNTMDQVRWVGTIGADYGVIGVAADSPVSSLTELMDQIKQDPSSVNFAGGSAVGGWDHLKVLLAAKKAGINDVRKVKYVAFDGGAEAVVQIMAGTVQAFTGDASEAKGFVESGDLKVLAILAPERLDGEFASFPTAKEQGIDVVGANWRGFYAPLNMSEEAYDFWVNSVGEVYASAEWKKTMEANGLAPLDLRGAEFEDFVRASVNDIETLSKEIGLIK
ncbi:MAG: tripartite tricarboxylate transporter substrate binding protein [Thalassospira sp.]|nr:tripartite tricarboxylate transporter substrate binding protein [Thalassospira sp.]